MQQPNAPARPSFPSSLATCRPISEARFIGLSIAPAKESTSCSFVISVDLPSRPHSPLLFPQDTKNAGTDTKNAAKEAGSATKKTTKKAYHKTKHGTKKVLHKISGKPDNAATNPSH